MGTYDCRVFLSGDTMKIIDEFIEFALTFITVTMVVLGMATIGFMMCKWLSLLNHVFGGF